MIASGLSHPRPARLLFCLAALCGLLLLSACAARQEAGAPALFPDAPLQQLAETPERSLAGAPGPDLSLVRGGWGYSRQEAFILAGAGRGRENAIALERRLIGLRNEVEFAASPARGQRFAVLDYGTISRTLRERDGRMFAVWKGKVSLISEQREPALFNALIAMPEKGRARAAGGTRPRMVDREYWFDISAVFHKARR